METGGFSMGHQPLVGEDTQVASMPPLSRSREGADITRLPHCCTWEGPSLISHHGFCDQLLFLLRTGHDG